MPYALIPMLAAVGLGIRYLFLPDASARSRIIVASAVLLSIAIWWYFPKWMVAATLLQVGVSIFVLLYLKVNSSAS